VLHALPPATTWAGYLLVITFIYFLGMLAQIQTLPVVAAKNFIQVVLGRQYAVSPFRYMTAPLHRRF
jgi:hypothetical protein